MMEGKLGAMDGVGFIARKQAGLFLHGSHIRALACRKCGAVFGFTLTNRPHHLTDLDQE